MQNDQIYFNIISLARTRPELDVLKGQVSELETGIYQTKSDNFEKILGEMPPGLVALIREGLKTIDKITFVRELKKKLEDVEYMQLTLAFEPTEKGLTKISDWVHKNLNQNVILEVVVNKVIIGGARVAVSGKYLDLSIKKILERKFAEEK